MLPIQLKQAIFKILALICSSFLFTGCAQKLNKEPLIHPYSKNIPLQECYPDLQAYKSIQLRPNQDPNLVLVVAASGGGYRASNFAAGVMLGLEQIQKSHSNNQNALSETDYFSTVSGGGFAVGAYITSLYDYTYFNESNNNYSFAKALEESIECPCSQIPEENPSTDPCIRSHLRGLYSDFIRDFLEAIIPFNELGFSDRGPRFELAIDDDILGYRWRKIKLQSLPDIRIYGPDDKGRNASLLLSDIFVETESQNVPLLPYWITNATVYKNGAILSFTPDQLSLYRINSYNHRMAKFSYAPDQASYKQFIWDMPIAVGVTCSANFPFAIPANTLTNNMDPNNPYLYVLDGGMADNFGAFTAVRLLNDPVNKTATRKALIIIDSYGGALSPYSSKSRPPSIANTTVRAMEIPLDSWRFRYRQVVDAMCEPENIQTIYFSFDDLADVSFEQLYEHGLTEQDKDEFCGNTITDCENATPFQLLRSITMSAPMTVTEKGLQYRLSTPQQNLLITAGKYVVQKKKNEILSALRWNE